MELMVLLALMRLGEDAYGVLICREIEEQTGREVAVGSVYATLERLEEKASSSNSINQSRNAAAGKEVFSINTTGVREVRERSGI